MSVCIERETGRFEDRLHIVVEYESWNERYKPHNVKTSGNGYQWSAISFADINDVAALRDALTDYIEEWDNV